MQLILASSSNILPTEIYGVFKRGAFFFCKFKRGSAVKERPTAITNKYIAELIKCRLSCCQIISGSVLARNMRGTD